MAKENKYMYPASGYLTQVFGLRTPPVKGSTKYHPGIDIANIEGTELYASADGFMSVPPYHQGYGNRIYILHSDNKMSYYSHVLKIIVGHETTVKKGQLIGRMGNTGTYTTGNHLHFGMKDFESNHSNWINPLYYIGMPEDQENIDIKDEWVEELSSGLWINKSARRQKEYVEYVTNLEKDLL